MRPTSRPQSGSPTSSSACLADGGPDTGAGAGAGLSAVEGSWADAGMPGRLPWGRDLLPGSAFQLAREGDGTGPGLATWAG